MNSVGRPLTLKPAAEDFVSAHTPTHLQIAQCVSDCFEPSDVSAIQRVIAGFGFLVADALIKRGFVAVSDAPGSPDIDLRDLAADLRAAAQSSVLMPEFGSDAVTSLTRWADLLAPGSPEGPQ